MEAMVPYAGNFVCSALGMLVKQIFEWCRSPPCDRIGILMEDTGYKLKVFNDLVESIRKGSNAVEEEMMVQLQKALEALRDEVFRIMNMGRYEYMQKSRVCQRNLHSLVKNVEWQLESFRIRIEMENKRLLTQLIANTETIRQNDQSKPTQVPFAMCLGDVTEAEVIHLNHRCDACHTKPIVGKRFRAIHLPDCDFCETCRTVYHGTSDGFYEV